MIIIAYCLALLDALGLGAHDAAAKVPQAAAQVPVAVPPRQAELRLQRRQHLPGDKNLFSRDAHACKHTQTCTQMQCAASVVCVYIPGTHTHTLSLSHTLSHTQHTPTRHITQATGSGCSLRSVPRRPRHGARAPAYANCAPSSSRARLCRNRVPAQAGTPVSSARASTTNM